MVTIRNIGEALLSHIENKDKTPIKTLNNLINEHKIRLQGIDEINMYKKEAYKTKYENPRIENNLKYDLYLRERKKLVNEWKTDKKSLALMLNFINFKRPELEDIPEIYTYQNIDLNPDKKTSFVQKPIAKPSKEKECPPGKVLNPKSGRCITEKPSKPTEPSKEKECPPGKVLNPKTGRCITEKPAKPLTEPSKPTEPSKEKECPPGKVLNPKSGRCITEKPVKECPPGKILNPKTGRCITEKK